MEARQDSAIYGIIGLVCLCCHLPKTGNAWSFMQPRGRSSFRSTVVATWSPGLSAHNVCRCRRTITTGIGHDIGENFQGPERPDNGRDQPQWTELRDRSSLFRHRPLRGKGMACSLQQDYRCASCRHLCHVLEIITCTCRSGWCCRSARRHLAHNVPLPMLP